MVQIDYVRFYVEDASAGLSFLPVPPSYYLKLRQKPRFNLSFPEFRNIIDLQILIDWQDEHCPAFLLQTFTQTIFPEPTFFFGRSAIPGVIF
jgi:4-hydroxyphenylpyruvate dioxygenase